MVLLHSPQRKSKYYFCRISDSNKKNIKLKIPYGTLLQYLLLSGQQGYSLHIKLPKNDYALENILEIEETCITEITNKNKEWFKNEMSEETIRELFQSSFDEDNILRCYISLLRAPTTKPGILVSELLQTYKHSLPKNIQVTILCDGLYIYPNSFGLRWIVSEIGDSEEPGDILPETSDIIEYWTEKKEACLEQLHTYDQHFRKKLQDISKLKEEIEHRYLRILEISNVDLLEEEIHRFREVLRSVDEKTFL